MNIIVARSAYPEDPLNGNDLRLWNLVQPEIHRVGIICEHQQSKAEASQLRWPGTCRLVPSLANLSMSRWNSSPARYLRKYHTSFEEVRRTLGEMERDLGPDGASIIACSHMTALALCGGRRGFIFELCDSMALYFHRRSEALRRQHPVKSANAWWMARVYLRLELFISRHASAITVASSVDAEFLRRRGAGCQVHAVPNGTDWLEAAPADPGAEGRRVVFHGNMGWEPNRVAAVYFASQVMPRLRNLAPDATLQIAGGPIFDELKRLDGRDGIQILGRVGDVKAVLRGGQVYAMPMFQGAGFKNKLAEAMAMGLPIVTNEMGAEAIDALGRALLVIAETPEAMAHALFELLSDSSRRSQMGKKTREYAAIYLGWEARQRQFHGILERMKNADQRKPEGI